MSKSRKKIVIFSLILFALLGLSAFLLKKNRLTGVSQIIVNPRSILIDLWINELPSARKELFEIGKKTKLIVRNRPHGELEIVSSQCIPLVPLTNEYFLLHKISKVNSVSVKTITPEQETLLWQCRLKLRDRKALFTQNGYLSQGNLLKIGSKINIEGQLYRLNGFIVDVYLEKTENSKTLE